MRKIIDLSMEVSEEMITSPGISRPVITQVKDHEEFAASIGAAKYGISSLTAHYVVVASDQVGTHMDSRHHMVKDAPGADSIPLEYCYGDGVLLDFSDKPAGYAITAGDVENKLKEIGYELKPLDIVLIKTGAACYNKEEKYLTDHCGMTREATLWLIVRGIKVMGIDAPIFDLPVEIMFKNKKFWEAHKVMSEKEYYHIENLENLDSIPAPVGFKLAVLPIKWKGTAASPVRAVAIIED